MVSPPKPWERNGAAVQASTPSAPITTTPSAPQSTPERPAALPSTIASASTAFSSSSPYGSLQPSSYSSYSSPYSRYGAYNTGLGPYGTMGSYGGYGSYGYGGLGSYGTYGMGMPGMPGMLGPNGLPLNSGDPTLTQSLESTTQHTFALLHSIVQTFTGVAQMLESTFFATHSSFFAMVGVIEQFGQLRDALGSVLGLFGLVRWLRDRLVGQRSQPEMGTEFREFVGSGGAKPPARVDSAPRPSKKPLIIFLLAVFGLPYAMMRIARALRERQQALAPNPSGAALPAPQRVLDPSTLRFARALYAFEPTSPSELGLKENEIVAIMGKLDPTTGVEVDPNAPLESEWWRGRTRDGREGWFPRKWVEVLEKKEPKKVQ